MHGVSPPPDFPDSELLDLVIDSVVVTDANGVVALWNSGSQAIYGWTRDEALGRETSKLFGQDSTGPVTPQGNDWHGEQWRQTSGGKRRLIELQRRNVQLPDGRQGCIETGRDITAAREAEDELRKSEHRYRNLFQAMAASFWELDFFPVGKMLYQLRKAGEIEDYADYFARHPEFVREMMRQTRVVDVNDQTVKLFGRGNKDELLTSVEPFWPEAASDVYAASVVASVTGKLNYSAETRLRRIDGSEFDALFTACFPPDTLNKGTLLVGVIDITERNRAFAELGRSENRYRNLFHQMPIALWQVDSSRLLALLAELRTKGVRNLSAYMDDHPEFLATAMSSTRVAEVNRSAIDLFGGKEASDLAGSSTRYWKSNPATFRRLLEARWRGDSYFEEETRMNAIDGRVLDGLFTIAFPPALNEIGISINAFVDMSEQKRSLAALRESETRFQRIQAEFAHASRVSMLGELAASIAHEVNQPLAAISASSAAGLRWLLREEPDIGEVKALMHRIANDTRRAADIIGRVRDMALPAEPRYSTVVIGEAVQDAVHFLQHEIRRQGVNVSISIPEGLPVVMADRIQLQQVFVNLAMNAVQAMASTDRPRLEIAGTCKPENIVVSVSDNGPGIAEANLPKLFDSFFSTRQGGMGMGLAIVRNIVESIGGSIVARNRGEGGALFIIRLPVHSSGQTG
ncbi:MAG: ATP-binding protein [Pseudomonadota bacterium]|nr:ATP-binding protein [Pseudomonadota bacterium]